MQDFQQMVGERVALARKQAGFSQEELSELVGLGDRQILSNIETGKRRVSSQELLQFVNLLGRDIDFFTNPHLVLGDGLVSWRADAQLAEVETFEHWALELVGVQRQLRSQLKEPVSPLRSSLRLGPKSSFEQAWAAAEDLIVEWALGEVPAARLRASIEEHLDVAVMMVDAPPGISGGAVNLDAGATIFVNRRHSRGRRHFTLAHELFHVLTWETMPPEKIDAAHLFDKKPRAEYLADNFAASLLMPLEVLRQKCAVFSATVEARMDAAKAGDFGYWFRETTRFFQVSAQALRYRLKALALLPLHFLESRETEFCEDAEAAAPFSQRFLALINRAIDRGLISAKRASTLLQTTLDDLQELLRQHQLEPSFNL